MCECGNFSKDPDGMKNEKTIEEVVAKLKSYGPGQVERFLEWVELFHGSDSRL